MRRPFRPVARATAWAGQAGRLWCSMCWRWTGRGAPAGAADRGQSHPERAWPGAVSAVVLQQALADLNAAYRNFFRLRPRQVEGAEVGRPRFRSRKDRRQAIRFTANARFKVLASGKLLLPKIGDVPVRWSRPLPPQPSLVTVIKEPRQARPAAVTARGAAGKTGSSPGAAQRSRKPTPSYAGTRHRRDSPPCKAERKSKRSGDPLPAVRLITYRPHQEGSGCPRIERQAQGRVPSAGPRCRAGLRSPGSGAAPRAAGLPPAARNRVPPPPGAKSSRDHAGQPGGHRSRLAGCS